MLGGGASRKSGTPPLSIPIINTEEHL